MKFAYVMGLLVLHCVGCAVAPATADDDAEQPVTGPTTSAAVFPFAAKISQPLDKSHIWLCTATIIAPRVLLTAGHCVEPGKPTSIDAPFVSKKSRVAKSSERLGNFGANNGPDLALVYLEPADAFALKAYPARARTIPAGSFDTQSVGRISNNGADVMDLVASEPVSASVSPFDSNYMEVVRTNGVVVGQHGDSGGPLLMLGTKRIIGVLSSGTTPEVGTPDNQNQGRSQFTRLDLAQCWIANKILAHGGEGINVETGSKPALSDFCKVQ
jgi:hypothetical protein